MTFLSYFRLLDDKQELDFKTYRKNIYNTLYPFDIFTNKNFKEINFEPITIFYGGNGSGKTTLLNIIAKSLKASVKNKNNLGELFDSYVSLCKYRLNEIDLREIKLITSDDVFDYLLDTRAINSRVNRRKNELCDEWLNNRFIRNDGPRDVMNEYSKLKDELNASKQTVSTYVRGRLTNNNIVSSSNGETALMFWENEIDENSIYLLDEPENSLSAENQLKLRNFIFESARYYNCQFIISTHSPFLLSLEGALIYDLDSLPVVTKKWNELSNVRIYHDFFLENSQKFTDVEK